MAKPVTAFRTAFSRLALVASLLVTIVGGLSAQPSEDWYLGVPIAEIRVTGLVNASINDIRGVYQPFVGETFSEPRFLDLQRRLYATDLFELVLAEALPVTPGDFSEVILEIAVTERPVVAAIRYEGNRRVRSADLAEVVLSAPGDVITRSRLRLDEQAIRQDYVERGYSDVAVSSRTEETERELRDNVVFVIEEGPRTVVGEIRFEGNNFASNNVLRSRMETRETNLFNSGVFQESILEADRQVIERYYQERGFIDARVVDITTEIAADPAQGAQQDGADPADPVSSDAEDSTMVITVTIEEGDVWTFAGISFVGNDLFSDEELASRVQQRNGQVVDLTRLQADLQRIADAYYNSGYIFNDIGFNEDRDPETLEVSYTVQIVERQRAYIESITVTGNEKTADEVILREIPLEVGDVFSVSRLRTGLSALQNLQYFSNVVPEFPPGSADGLMQLLISVEEQRTANIQLGFSTSGDPDFPIAAVLGWEDSNFRGTGQALNANLNVSPAAQNLSFGFTERWFRDRRWSLGGQVALNRNARQGVDQDIIAPIFSSEDESAGIAVPDPYTGVLVFGTADGATAYEADTGTPVVRGQIFPGIPDEAAIDSYDLVTDYAYAIQTGTVDTSYQAEYIDWDITLGVSSGYRWLTGLGQLSLNGGLNIGISYLNYDQATVRPASAQIRANFQRWRFDNRISVSTALDTRDFFISPSSGYLFSQSVSYNGGVLGGLTHYIRTTSRGQAFFTLFDIPVGDAWNWKMVLGFNSSLALVFPQFYIINSPDGSDVEPNLFADAQTDLLRVDASQSSSFRGWPIQSGGRAIWENWMELRMPIVEQFAWLDGFVDAGRFYESRADIGSGGIENFLMSFGAGIRFTLPQFPIRLYLAQPFRINPTSFIPERVGGADFVISLGGLF